MYNTDLERGAVVFSHVEKMVLARYDFTQLFKLGISAPTVIMLISSQVKRKLSLAFLEVVR